MAVSCTMRVQVRRGTEAFDWETFDSSSFDTMTSVSLDVLGAAGLRLKYGIDGSGPLDRVASTGECSCTLRNDARNSHSLQGVYSPSHTNALAGWGFGKPFRVVFTYNGTDYIKFTGKIRVIDPDAGRYWSQRVHVTAYDCMRDLAEADAREVTIQTNKSEDELLDALIAIMPSSAQPFTTDFDAGVDSYPYSFDNVAGGAKVLAVMRDIVVSSFGMLTPNGNGTLRYLSRHALAITTSAYSFNDNMIELKVPSSLDGVFNRARATNHPKQVSSTATDELYTLPTGTAVEIPVGASSFEIWTDYTDPNDRQTHIGGTAVVTALVGGTHYVANSQADGGGSNLTSSITASLTAFGTTAKWTFSNAAATAAFLTTQKVIGKAVRDPGPQTFEAYSAQDYGDRPVDIDLPNQDDPYIGQSVADYVVMQYSTLSQQIESIAFIANSSDALMTQALAREPGDRITITETLTGVSSVDAIIQSVEFEVAAGIYIICRWGLVPADANRYWQLGVAGASELGDTTVLGF